MSRWRKRIGEEGVEVLLAVTIEAARAAGLIKRSSLDKVIVDTTVMRKALKALRIRVTRVYREVTRKLGQLPERAQIKAKNLLHRVGCILTQKTRGKNKLYALHAPEAECIAKGKARTLYEFGVKVSIATTLKEGLVVGCRSMPGNPYDGHTLDETIEQVEILAEQRPGIAIVDKGYRGVQVHGGADSPIRPAPGRHPNHEGDDQAKERDRADHWP